MLVRLYTSYGCPRFFEGIYPRRFVVETTDPYEVRRDGAELTPSFVDRGVRIFALAAEGSSAATYDFELRGNSGPMGGLRVRVMPARGGVGYEVSLNFRGGPTMAFWTADQPMPWAGNEAVPRYDRGEVI
jgi:hypothetical protein